jgi:hypothetical protein
MSPANPLLAPALLNFTAQATAFAVNIIMQDHDRELKSMHSPTFNAQLHQVPEKSNNSETPAQT